MLKTSILTGDPLSHKTECLALVCVEGDAPAGVLKKIDARLKGAIAQAYKSGRFKGKLNETLLLNTRGLLAAENLLLSGAGKQAELSEEKLRQAAGSAVKLAKKSQFKKVTCVLPHNDFEKHVGRAGKRNACGVTRAAAEGVCLALYRFDVYKTKKDANGNGSGGIKEVRFLAAAEKNMDAMRRALAEALKVSAAVTVARDLIAHPGNKATPAFLAEAARRSGAKYGFRCKILDPQGIRKLGMGALLGVARGSHEPARFIIMEYSGGRKNQAPVVIVGKGLTFDAGGISLKPAAGMDEMKTDMSGAATTIGVLQAVADLKLPVNVVGLVPSTENMPGGSATKPGDILTSMSGKTIEVLNTDAEGRLILADALTYAARYKPRAVIDLATLTGACIVALGHHASAVLGNDQELIDRLKECGEATGERLWQLPLWEEFEKAMKSDIADLKNIAGSAVGAGTITGAAFLKAFVKDYPWAHFDIAGTAWSNEDKPYTPKGPVGVGIRLLLRYLESLS